MDLYPSAPIAVPSDLTRPSRAYRWRAWLAALALALFVMLYVGLTVWFGASGVLLLRDAASGRGERAFGSFLLSLPLFFFCGFLLAGLFFPKLPSPKLRIEVTERDEPTLLAFLHQVAADVRAPRPRRVFLSPGVNASVIQDLSPLHLLLPSRKDLDIGLGLINALTLAELKAVVAHEFGHFGQDMMALGRWVYIAEQIAARIVAQRGFFDRVLRGLTRLDARLVVIAFPLGLLIWAIRALLDTAFRVVALALRALMREMELQADLVSVSVAGSDALVHALHKLHAADDAHERAFDLMRAELARGRPMQDLFAVQTRVLEVIRAIRDDPNYGRVPTLPEQGRQEHRVFPDYFAQPPRMWSTHPGGREREDNVKRRYVPGTLDDRPAWVLFADPDSVRKRATRELLQSLAEGVIKQQPVALTQTLEQVDRHFNRAFFDRRYRGAYLGRPITLHVQHPRELYGDSPSVGAELDALYPAGLSEDLERRHELERELAALKALQAGVWTATGGVLRHRGREISRAGLAPAIQQVDAELALVTAKVRAHDRACRSLHRSEAARLGRGWPEYLEGLLALLHYAEHSAHDLSDASGHLQHVFAVVSADRTITRAEALQLVSSGQDLYRVLLQLFEHRLEVILPEPVQRALGMLRWAEVFPAHGLLPPPDTENLPQWLPAIDGWVAGVLNALRGLDSATLEELLQAEAHVSRCVREGRDPGDPPQDARVPRKYARRPTGSERERRARLDLWDRLQLAHGLFPAALRLLAACAVLAPLFWLNREVQRTIDAIPQATVSVLNGLDVPVQVHVAGTARTLEPRDHGSLAVTAGTRVTVTTTAAMSGALIEQFEADVSDAHESYVYNVAGAAPLVEWTATYGHTQGPPPRRLGTPHFFISQAQAIFAAPPRAARGSTRHRVLESGARREPLEQLEMCTSALEAMELVKVHALLDEPGRARWHAWLYAGRKLPGFRELLGSLRHDWPDDITLRVIEHETAPDADTKDRLCEEARAQLSAARADPNLRFLVARCVDAPEQQMQAVLEAYAEQPDHGWSALAAGFIFARSGQLSEADEALRKVKRRLSFMAPTLEAELERARGATK